MEKCLNCGNACGDSSKFCVQCGYKFEEPITQIQEDSPFPAPILQSGNPFYNEQEPVQEPFNPQPFQEQCQQQDNKKIKRYDDYSTASKPIRTAHSVINIIECASIILASVISFFLLVAMIYEYQRSLLLSFIFLVVILAGILLFTTLMKIVVNIAFNLEKIKDKMYD